MTNPTDYDYFLDKDGDVWRQAPDKGRREFLAGSWEESSLSSRFIEGMRPLTLGEPTLGEPTLPTEPGLYLVNYSEDRPLLNHSIVYLARAGAEWHHLDSWDRWTPRGGDTLTRLDVVRERN